jgi:hypothetical protein
MSARPQSRPVAARIEIYEIWSEIAGAELTPRQLAVFRARQEMHVLSATLERRGAAYLRQAAIRVARRDGKLRLREWVAALGDGTNRPAAN